MYFYVAKHETSMNHSVGEHENSMNHSVGEHVNSMNHGMGEVNLNCAQFCAELQKKRGGGRYRGRKRGQYLG